MKKISHKIIAAILACSITMCSGIVLISTIKSVSLIEQEANGKMKSVSEAKANELSLLVGKAEMAANNVSSSVKGIVDAKNLEKNIAQYDKELNNLSKSISEENKEFVGTYFALNPKLTKNVYDYIYEDPDLNGTYEEMDSYKLSDFDETNVDMNWYYEPIKQKKGVWSKAYIDKITQLEMISYTLPIYKDNILIGVAGVDLDFKKFRDTINNIKIYDTGYAFLLDKDYNYMIHKTLKSTDNLRTLNGSAYKYIADEMDKEKIGVTHSNFEGETFTFGYSRLNNGWILVTVANEKEVLSGVQELIIIGIIVIIVGIMISIVVALIIGKRMSTPIVKLTEIISKIANLDLAAIDLSEKDIKMLTSKDEVGQMATATEKLVNELRKFIQVINENSEQVLKYSEELDAETKETIASMNAIAYTVEELAQGSTEQAIESQKGAEELDSLANELNIVVDASEIVKEYSNHTKEVSENGMRSIIILGNKVKESIEISTKVAENTEVLAKKSDFINGIVVTIEEIAAQTNLLALNAAIEAARAGEAGKGFAVVADEIRNLSEKTGQSTKEIASIVKDLQQGISRTKSNMELAKSVINEQEDAMSDSKNSFDNITKAVTESINQVNVLAGKVKGVNENKNAVVNAIQGISAITEEAAASTEEVSASVEEQLASMENIGQTTANLKVVVNSLEEAVKRFKI